ncbi:ribosomal protein S12 methylthiotransferase RimO [Friedmanniella endophytica]|uniref:Ribosomal protein uS12 methylthiotransferase RimO n=1 Tax=Microlunatus kandeliicorticis TaxID=1759536 RepID=A0A7W3IUJ2_9ACTN|nr:30S ribosomal protein S12 methylthiotransferase RimO [Microlunatus kandeliicorticis]MBA8795440.1 ribosomal protein S12 methylthiotransferase RimO [Microlunatus kandeliicorticis]
MTSLTAVHLVTLGCARNEVDSEELAGRLADGGFRLVDDPEAADAVLVNTCGFVESAKKDSVDELLAAADLKQSAGQGGRAQAVVAVGCLAERYGHELAESLPEADAVLGFDAYGTIAERLQAILAGERPAAHVPRDRRTLLPISPVDRPAAGLAVPGHATPDLPAGLAPAAGPRPVRRRLDGGPSGPLKIASGCDRRCSFCAIPTFRGAYLSRPPAEIVAEAQWLVEQGVREVFLVSENTSAYGKDLADLRLLEKLLVELSGVDGLDWIRVSYLQPAELRPGLVEVMTSTPRVLPYFDLSFQHAAPGVLRRMRRFGDPDSFLGLLDRIRTLSPRAGVRSNVICGFPGETEADLAVLTDFLSAARLDAIGVFGYSDEDGTEAVRLDGHLDEGEIEARRSAVADLADELVAQRAEERIGETVSVLVLGETDGSEGPRVWEGRAEHQAPEVDGTTVVVPDRDGPAPVGRIVTARVVASDGVDLVTEPLAVAGAGDR